MSFGFSVGDFAAAVSLAWSLYKQCKGASEEFREVSEDVGSLLNIIGEIQDEAEDAESILNRAGHRRKQELDMLMRSCTEVLSQLQQILTRYRSLGTQEKRTWDKVKFGAEDIQAYRNKLLPISPP